MSPKNKERQTKATPRTPAKGTRHSTWPTLPYREHGPSAAVLLREPVGSIWRFSGKQSLDARASFKLSIRVLQNSFHISSYVSTIRSLEFSLFLGCISRRNLLLQMIASLSEQFASADKHATNVCQKGSCGIHVGRIVESTARGKFA